MVRQKIVNIRVTENQHKLMKLRMEAKGYLNFSEYVRETLLKEDFAMEHMIKEIYRSLLNKMPCTEKQIPNDQQGKSNG